MPLIQLIPNHISFHTHIISYTHTFIESIIIRRLKHLKVVTFMHHSLTYY
jgi:hypothetical protein